jgi:hypothetical protein
MKWTIVKFASDVVWSEYFLTDPKDGVDISQSASATYAGKAAELSPRYTSFELAVAECNKINTQNPSGHYDVCKLIEDAK